MSEPRPMVMGILNVTADSFSDGGCYPTTADALARARTMVDEGADVVDVGGESSRPGATGVAEAEELRRVLPVVEALAGSVRVSVDTVKPSVARAAVAAGATLINDVSGQLWPVAAELSVGWVCMHRRGTPTTMQQLTDYDDVVSEVMGHLVEGAARASTAGVPEVWVDPGIGFAKTAEQNLDLLSAIDRLVEAAGASGARVLVGASRKQFLARFGAVGGEPLAVHERLEASLAVAAWCFERGVQMLRVHDVAPSVMAAGLVGRSAARAA